MVSSTTLWTRLCESTSNVTLVVFPQVQTEQPGRVRHERYHACEDQDGDEDRSDRIKASPAISIDEKG